MNICLKYYNPQFNIAMADLRSAWLLEKEPVKLSVIVYRGALIYRLPKSGKRISYRQLKKALVKRQTIIRQPGILLPF